MDLIAGKKCYYKGDIPEGTQFSAPRQYARTLIQMKRATEAPKTARGTYKHRAITKTQQVDMVADPIIPLEDIISPDLVVEEAPTDMQALRREYAEVVGKRAYSGWDEATLRAKMAEAEDE